MKYITRNAFGFGILTIANSKASVAFITHSLRTCHRHKIYNTHSDDSKLDIIGSFGYDDDILSSPQSNWGAEDDWHALSGTSNSAYMFRGDYDVIDAADRLLVEHDSILKSRRAEEWEPSTSDGSSTQEEVTSFVKENTDQFVDDAVEMIVNQLDYEEDVALYDTKSSESLLSSQNEQDEELIFMIRCNQSPQQFLISQGRALSELTAEEKYSAEFLFEKVNGQDIMISQQQPEMTLFFKNAVRNIFNRYSTKDEGTDAFMDRNALANWMTTCLSYDLSLDHSRPIHIGPHDSGISVSLSRYCLNNGSGRLTFDEFITLYHESSWVGYLNDARNRKDVVLVNGRYHPVPSMEDSFIVKDKMNTNQFLRDASLSIIWRDLEAHGIFSPAEEERVRLIKEMEEKHQSSVTLTAPDNNMMMDECELYDDYEDHLSRKSDGEYGVKREEKSSHKLVEMSLDGTTPKRIRDGEFVFIDEESCIGCSQCATIAPTSFKMLEDTGRARTFFQRNTDEIEHAVMSCPVNCMHMVSYDELKEMETSRDEESFGGRTHVPVHVAGRDSDANRKSSWYHYLKAKCGSTACPQRGCYDCPNFARPGENPYFQLRHKHAEHIRANEFIASGDAKQWRKVAEL